MTYNVFGGTLSLTQSINQFHVDRCGCGSYDTRHLAACVTLPSTCHAARRHFTVLRRRMVSASAPRLTARAVHGVWMLSSPPAELNVRCLKLCPFCSICECDATVIRMWGAALYECTTSTCNFSGSCRMYWHHYTSKQIFFEWPK